MKKAIMLYSGGADSLMMLDLYCKNEKSNYESLQLIYIDQCNLSREKVISEYATIDRQLNIYRELYPDVNITIEIIHSNHTLRPTNVSIAHAQNPIWIGSIISILPLLPENFDLFVGFNGGEGRYLQAIREVLKHSENFYLGTVENIKDIKIDFGIRTPIINYTREYIYNYLLENHIYHLFWTCENPVNPMMACLKCIKCMSHMKESLHIMKENEFMSHEITRSGNGMKAAVELYHELYKTRFSTEINSYILRDMDLTKLRWHTTSLEYKEEDIKEDVKDESVTEQET